MLLTVYITVIYTQIGTKSDVPVGRLDQESEKPDRAFRLADRAPRNA